MLLLSAQYVVRNWKRLVGGALALRTGQTIIHETFQISRKWYLDNIICRRYIDIYIDIYLLHIITLGFLILGYNFITLGFLTYFNNYA